MCQCCCAGQSEGGLAPLSCQEWFDIGDQRIWGVGLNPRAAILGPFYNGNMRSLGTVEPARSSALEMRDVVCFRRGCE